MQLHGVITQLYLFTGLDTKMPNFFLVASKMSHLEYLNHVDYKELVLPHYLGHQQFIYHLGYLMNCRVILKKGKNVVHRRNVSELES